MTRNIDGQEVRYFHTKKNGVDRVWIDNEAFLAKVLLNDRAQFHQQHLQLQTSAMTSTREYHAGVGQDGRQAVWAKIRC